MNSSERLSSSIRRHVRTLPTNCSTASTLSARPRLSNCGWRRLRVVTRRWTPARHHLRQGTSSPAPGPAGDEAARPVRLRRREEAGCSDDRASSVLVPDPDGPSTVNTPSAAGERPRAERIPSFRSVSVSYTHLRAHETRHDLVCRLLLEKKK